MTEIPVFGPEVDPLIARGILLSRLRDGLRALDLKRFADLVANPVQPRVIRPVKHRRPPTHIKATVEDPYHQAGAQTPVSRETFRSTADAGLNPTNTVGVGFNGDMTATNLTVCDCGMGYKGTPHPCMKWHYKMLTPEAKQDFQAVVKKHCGGYIPNPALSLDLLSEDTQEYLKRVVNPKQRPQGSKEDVQPVMVRFMPSVLQKLERFRNDDGQKLTLKPSGKADPYGVIDIIVTIEDDPEWVKTFSKKHEEKKFAMPICCPSPDPRIAKSGRPYCHNCKKYLDKVPPPQEPVVTINSPKQ